LKAFSRRWEEVTRRKTKGGLGEQNLKKRRPTMGKPSTFSPGGNMRKKNGVLREKKAKKRKEKDFTKIESTRT